MAHGITGPELWSYTEYHFGHPYSVHRLPAQTFVIATVCKFQVIASQSYANFPSIDQLRQDLLDRYVHRARIGDSTVPDIDHFYRTVPQDSSWEGGAPEVLPLFLDDDGIEPLYNYYIARTVAAPEQSDSYTGNLSDDTNLFDDY